MSKYPSQTQDKFTVRFPDGLRDAIAKQAEENGRSMNSEIVQILQDAVDGKAHLVANSAYDINELNKIADENKKMMSEHMKNMKDEIEKQREILKNQELLQILLLERKQIQKEITQQTSLLKVQRELIEQNQLLLTRLSSLSPPNRKAP